MRLHKNLCQAVADGLEQIFFEQQYADKVVQQLLKRDKRWGSKDRKFIAENIYDIVRWKRFIKFIGNIEEKPNRMWHFLGVWLLYNEIALPDWEEFEPIIHKKLNIKGLQTQSRAVTQSIPDWMDALGEKELGTKLWEDELYALNFQAQVVLRANGIKTDAKGLLSIIEKEQIEAELLPEYPDAIQLIDRKNVFTLNAFKEGYFELQDASSQLVAPFLEVSKGMRVVDACAGAGGKTLHLASLMQNKGQIIALDIFQWKLNELKKRARRNGISMIETRLIESSKTIKRLANSVDRLLIDAPCSGLGVLKRNPDAKWKLAPDFIENIINTQAEILDQYAKMVKSNGKMVYATCSILPSENTLQVQKFLANHPEFELEEEKQIYAHTSGYDGFYMARLVKKG